MPYKDPESYREYQREYMREYQRRRRKDPKEREKDTTRMREARQANPEATKAINKRCYDKDPEKKKARSRKWRAENPHRSWASDTISNHRSMGYIIAITIDDLVKKARETKICLYCKGSINYTRGNGINKSQVNLDRINNEKIINKTNSQIICHSCNASKKNRTHIEFLQYLHLVGA